MHWYAAHGSAWVVRQTSVEYLCPAVSGGVLDVTTWVSGWRRVRAQREYVMRRQSDGGLIARGSADWVYVDRDTGWPRRIPPELATGFGDPGETVLTPYRLPSHGLEAGAFRLRHQTGAFLDLQGRSTPAPQAMLDALLQGEE